MFLVETSSTCIVSFACVALNLDAVPLSGEHGRPHLIKDLDISMGLAEDLDDLEDPRDLEQDFRGSKDFERNFKDLEDPSDFDHDLKVVEDQQWIDIETGSSNVLDEEVSRLLLGSRPVGVRNPSCMSLLRTRSGGGGSEERETGLISKSRHGCQRRGARKSDLRLIQNSVMQRPSLDFDKMQVG